jgi:anti-sigma B factor antagonist
LATKPLLRVEVQQATPGVVVIRCEGEVDLTTCEELREAIGWSFTPDLTTLRLDLTAVEFFDSAGIRCLVECHRRCAELDIALEVVTSPAVERVLSLVGFREATQT